MVVSCFWFSWWHQESEYLNYVYTRSHVYSQKGCSHNFVAADVYNTVMYELCLENGSMIADRH